MQDSLHLRLFEARTLAIGTEWNTADVQSSFWRLYRNDSDGAGLLRADGEYALAGGRVYFVPSGVRFTCVNRRPMRHFYVHFDVIGLPGPVARELFSTPVRLPESGALEAALDGLAAEPDSADFGRQCRVKSALYAALGLAFQAAPQQQIERMRRLAQDWEPVRPAIDYIDRHLAETLDNALLAAVCCLSEDYFIRRFRECIGQTPNRYIQERRAQRAAQDLLFTSDGIDQIAERTGYGSRSYFTRQFARHTGLSPAAYRRAKRV